MAVLVHRPGRAPVIRIERRYAPPAPPAAAAVPPPAPVDREPPMVRSIALMISLVAVLVGAEIALAFLVAYFVTGHAY